jgi:hypothetical protein
MDRRSLALAAATLGGVVAVAVPATAQSPTTKTLTFKETDKGSTFTLVDNPPRSKSRRAPTLSAGDVFVLSDPLVSTSGAKRGVLQANCSVTRATRNPDKAPVLCQGVFTFKEGQLDALVSSNGLSNVLSGAIVGGTGAYAGARGTFRSANTKTGSNDTVTLLG